MKNLNFHIIKQVTMRRLYAVKVQRSLAPLSRFRGSHIPSAHEQECCRFQSYASCAIAYEIYKRNVALREPHSWDPRQRTTWSRVVTLDFNSVLKGTHIVGKVQITLAFLSYSLYVKGPRWQLMRNCNWCGIISSLPIISSADIVVFDCEVSTVSCMQ